MKLKQKLLLICIIITGTLLSSNAQSLEDYTWLNSVIDTENCCDNQSVELYRYANTFDFIYIQNDANCLWEGGRLYDANGAFWCFSFPDYDCLGYYNFDFINTIYTCDQTQTSEVDLFRQYPWLNSTINTNDCCSNNEVTVYRNNKGHEFISIATDSNCSTANDKFYLDNGQFYCENGPNYNCVQLYGFSDIQIIATWTCGDGQPEPPVADITLRNTLQDPGEPEVTYASLFGQADDAYDEFATFSETETEFPTALAQTGTPAGDISGLYEIDLTETSIEFTVLPDESNPFWMNVFGVFPAEKFDRYYFTFAEPHNITSASSDNSSVNLRIDSETIVVVEISEGFDLQPGVSFLITLNNEAGTDISLRNTLQDPGEPEVTYASLFGQADDAYDEFATLSETETEFPTALAQTGTPAGDISGLYEIDLTETSIEFTALPDESNPFWMNVFGIFPAEKFDRYYFNFAQPHNITSASSNHTSVNVRIDSETTIVVEISEGFNLQPGVSFFISLNGEDGLTNEQKARAFNEGLITGDASVIKWIRNDYLQHNLSVPTGKEPIAGFYGGQPTGITVDIHRSFEVGDYVFAQTTLGGTWGEFFGSGTDNILYEVWRFENGFAVEHWDNIVAVVDDGDGTTQTDGTTTPATDLDKTDANKALLEEMAQTLFVDGDWTNVRDYFDLDNYIQHSVGAGPDGAFLASLEGQTGVSFYDDVKFVHVLGNFGLVMSQGGDITGQDPDNPYAYYDLFRIENGKIVEHWDAIQLIPPQEEWAHDNGKWGDDAVSSLPPNVGKIADNIYTYGQGFGIYSMFIVTTDGVIAIESFNSQHAAGMLEAIGAITDQPVKFLLHSHDHWDHSSGGQVFKDAGATTMAHTEAYKWMEANPNPDMALPDESWEGCQKNITLGETTVELHYLGINHGQGMTVFLVPDQKVAFVADLVTPNRVLFSIVPDFNIPEWERSLLEIMDMDFDKAVYSHNEYAEPLNGGDKQDVQLTIDFINDLRGAIFAEFQKGTPAGAIPTTVKLPKYEDWVGYDAWLHMNAWRILLDIFMGPFPLRPVDDCVMQAGKTELSSAMANIKLRDLCGSSCTHSHSKEKADAGNEKTSPPQAVEIAENIYSYGPNGFYSMFIVTTDGVIAIEPANTAHSEGMLEAIKEVTDQPVKYLLYSHDHWDHSSGGQVFKDAGATTMAHIEAYDAMHANPGPDMLPPDESWEGCKTEITLGETTVELHYLGINHGLGMTVFLIPDQQVAYIADLAVPNRVLFTIVPDFNMKEWERSLEQIIEMDFDKAVYSHNEDPDAVNGGDKQDAINNLQLIKDIRAAIQTEIQNGANPFVIASTLKLPEYENYVGYDDWFEMNVWRVFIDELIGPYPYRAVDTCVE